MMANCKQTMATVKRSVPLFLSSSKDVTGDADETSFTVRLSPPLNISDQAKKVTAFIDSATIPYSFPNVSSSTSTVIVRIPLGAGQGNSGEVPLTLPTGVYTLSEIAQQINEAVNAYLHSNHYPVLVGSWSYFDFNTGLLQTKAATPNFCSLLPNEHINRVELTLAYDDSEIDFADADTTLDDLLGLTSKCNRTAQAQVVVPAAGYELTGAFRTTILGAGGPSWVNVTFTVAQGTYTAPQLVTEINSKFVTAIQARANEDKDNPRVPAAAADAPLLSELTLEASDEVPGEFRVDFDYANFPSFSLPTSGAGTCVLGNYDAGHNLTSNAAQLATMLSLVGNYQYFSSSNDATRASFWTGGSSTAKFTAEKAATIDKVTEVGIAAPGLAHGSYSADGNSAGATLARFQVTGGPGSNMVFRPPNPIKVDVSHLIGASVQEIKLMLVDQHGAQIDSLLGEKFSAVLIIESE